MTSGDRPTGRSPTHWAGRVAGERTIDGLDVVSVPLKVPVLEGISHYAVVHSICGPRLVFQCLAVDQTRVDKYTSRDIHSRIKSFQKLLYNYVQIVYSSSLL